MFDEKFLLHSDLAVQLYRVASALPVIDFHNHLPAADLAADRQYADLAELWVVSDPYKHRAMRICGIPEALITGRETSGREKFQAWASVVPKLLGNPLYHWTMLELKRVFGIEEELNSRTAETVWVRAGELLRRPEYSARNLLKRFHVVYAAPCRALLDDADALRGVPACVPSLRGDDVQNPSRDFPDKLSAQVGFAVDSRESFRRAVALRLDAWHEAGCRIADHSLDNGFAYRSDEGRDDALFGAFFRDGKAADPVAFRSAVLRLLLGEYARRGWLLQLHIGAQRSTSARLRKLVGPAGGFAGIGRTCDIASLAALLNDGEQGEHGLPRVVLYTLNPADHAALAVLAGSFPGDGVAGKVQLGPAWWYCDHIAGMRDNFEQVAAFGVLSQAIGMTTDSRSPLSFVRHEYFRRVFAAFLAEKAGRGEMPDDVEKLSRLVRAVCFENAATYLGVKTNE